MIVSDAWKWLTSTNPIGQTIAGEPKSVVSRVTSIGGQNQPVKAAAALTTAPVEYLIAPLFQLTGRHYYFIRLAGVSGAAAVLIGIVGRRFIDFKQDKGQREIIFDTANTFHLFHSFAIMALPLAKHPCLTGSLMICGVLLFCGPLYHRVFTNNRRFVGVAPLGGLALTVGWLSLLL